MAALPQSPAVVTTAPALKPATKLWSWITTVDHKRVGVLYGLAGLTFFLLGGLEALLIRVQLIKPNNEFVTAEEYNALFTMHGTTMIFLAVMPLATALFNFVVPLQIGARDVAFPRMNAFSFWTALAGGIILNISWFFAHAPSQGWYGYAPLTEREWMPGQNVDFWILGLQVLGVASIAASINMIVTILNMRAPGMTMMRMPIFTWSTLITSILIVMAFPAITIALILLSMDRFAGTGFYRPAAGGDPLLWQHLFWVFGHPEVYILILPAFGIVSEIIPVFSRKPLFGYSVMVYALAAIAFLGFGVWIHHMFTTGLGTVVNAVFSGSTMLIAIPTGVKIFNWVGTMFRGSLNFTTPMLFAVGLVSQFTIGGLSGVMHAVSPIDYHQNDSYFVVAHFHYVLFGGAIFGFIGGIYYWFPKITGRLMDDRLGRWNFWTTFLAFNGAFFPMHFLGLQGMPRRYFTYGEGSNWQFWNVVVSISAFALGASVLLFFYNIGKSLQHGELASENPWDAATLEWATPSPPPEYNFAQIPRITHRDPIWWEQYDRHTDHGNSGKDDAQDLSRVNLVTGPIHMPNPSYYPIIASTGILIAALGLIFDDPRITIGLFHLPSVSLVGILIFLFAVYGWAFEPAS